MTSVLLLTIVGSLIVSALTHRRAVQPGLIVLVVACAVSFVPSMERVTIDPHLILGLVMPPLLYSAALHFSFFSFLRNFRAIFALGVGLVVVTTFVVGGLTALIVPSLGFSAALVLAAIVSPPDSVTIVTRGREIGLPSRVTAILTGESLVNDATALTIITITITAITGDHALFDNPFALFGYGVVVGVLVGLAVGTIIMLVRNRVVNATLENALGLLVPFAAYLAAEELHGSGVIAVVIAGFGISGNAVFDPRANKSPIAYRTRLQERELWPVVDALLEAFVFAYMGLQLRFIIDDLQASGEDSVRIVLLGFVVLVAVIGVRFAWVFAVFGRWNLKLRWHARSLESNARYRVAWERRLARREERHAAKAARHPHAVRPAHRATERVPISRAEMLLVSWTGMRGIVTLAAAGSIPLLSHGDPFPGREAIQVIAFIVAIGTLLLQGSTLPWLARRLNIDLSDEIAFEAAELAHGRELLAQFDVREFELRRDAIRSAVFRQEIDDVIARELLASIDLDQAAFATRD